MKKVYSDVIQFRGNHYEFGRMQGELLKKSPILPNRKKQWGKDSLNFIIDVKKYYDIIMQFAPNIWDEINGLADRLEMSMLDAVKDFGGYYLQFRRRDRKSTRLNSSHVAISYAVFCLKKKRTR